MDDAPLPSRWKRWRRRLLFGVFGFGASLVGFVCFCVFTSVGTRLMLRAATALYASSIAGDVGFETSEGAIASGVTIRGLSAKDATGTAIASVSTVRIGVDIPAALTGTINLGTVVVEGSSFRLDGALEDLAPPSDEPAPPSETLGPDLPIQLIADLSVRDFSVVRGTETLTRISVIYAGVRAQGTRASLTLEAGASVPLNDIDVHAVSLEAAWDEPILTVDGAALQSSEGDVWLDSATFDAVTHELSVGSASARLTSDRFGTQVQGATAQVSAQGTSSSLSAELSASVPELGEVFTTLEGGLGPTPWLRVLVDGAAFETETLPPIELQVDAVLEGDLTTGLDGAVLATCRGCDDALDPVRANATIRAAPGASVVSVDAAIDSASIRMTATGAAHPSIGGGLSASIRIPRLSELEPLARRFAPGLELRGAVELEAGCGVLTLPQFAACRAWGGIDNGVPVDRARFDMSVGARGDQLVALVHSLEVDQGSARLRVKRPAEFRYAPDAVSAHHVRARLGTTAGLGALALDGRLELQGAAPRVDAELRLTDFSLAALDAVVPDVSASGRLGADVIVAGSLAAPILEASVRGTSLRALGVDVGDVAVDARFAGTDLDIAVDGRRGDLGTVELRAALPVGVDTAAGVVELLPRERASLRVGVRGARLAAVSALAPSLETLRGDVDVNVLLSGSLANGRIELDAALRDGAFDSHILPYAGIRANYRRQSLGLEFVATHPEAFDRIALDADIPVRLDLARGKATLSAARPLDAELVIAGADLAYAKSFDPNLELDGAVGLRAKVQGTASTPIAEATVDVTAAGWKGRSAGSLSLALGYEGGLATAQAWASGPDVSGVGLDATIPITVDLVQAQPRWHPERPHALHVAVNEALLRPVLSWVPDLPSIDADGRVHLQLDITGAAVTPLVELRAEGEALEYGGRTVGGVELDGRYADSRASAEVLWEAPEERTAWVRASVPVVVDVPGGTAMWQRTGHHEVRLAVPKLDPTLLQPFVDVGEFDGAFGVFGVGSGHLEDFELGLSARGNVRSRGTSLPVDARLVATSSAQSMALDFGKETKLRVETTAAIPELVRGADWRKTPVKASADIKALQLSKLGPFLPTAVQGLRGQLDSRVRAAGTLGKPTFDGDLALAGGSVTVVPARVRLTEISAHSSFSQDAITLENLSFKAGDGSARASGALTVDADTGTRSTARLDVKKFPLRAPGLPRMALSTGLDVEALLTLEHTDVDVLIDRTLVDVYATSISAAAPIPTNSNVVLADLSKAAARAEGVESASEPSPKRVRVRFGDDIRIIGPSIDMRWGGALEAKTTSTRTTTSGQLEAGRGTFSLLGNEFDLDSGTVYLAEDESGMPFLDVVATTSVDDVAITVTIRGPASRPEFELKSVPALPQSEIFTILVTGTSDTQGADSDEVQDKAAAVLAAMSNGALQRQLGATLRVDKIGVGFGDSSDQPILSVGKNITRDVYAETEYHHNAPADQNRAQLEVEYEFAPRWSLETFFGDAAQGGISVFWGIAFDTD